MRNYIGPVLVIVAVAIMVIVGANFSHSEPYVCGKKAGGGTVHAVYCGVQ